MHPSRPGVLFMQKHWDVMRSDDGGDSWKEISGDLPSDFGFPIEVHAHEPDTIYVVPIKSDSEHYPPEGKLRVYRSRTGGNEWEALTKGLPQRDCYVNVLRDAMAVDSLEACGVYFGTTGGQVYGSFDAGDSWTALVRDLPAVLSVEVRRSNTARGFTSTARGVSGFFQDRLFVYAQLDPVSQLPTMRESSQPIWSEATRVSGAQRCAKIWSKVTPARTSGPAVYFGSVPERKLPVALACPPPRALVAA
jgi:hypothetical protein